MSEGTNAAIASARTVGVFKISFPGGSNEQLSEPVPSSASQSETATVSQTKDNKMPNTAPQNSSVPKTAKSSPFQISFSGGTKEKPSEHVPSSASQSGATTVTQTKDNKMPKTALQNNSVIKAVKSSPFQISFSGGSNAASEPPVSPPSTTVARKGGFTISFSGSEAVADASQTPSKSKEKEHTTPVKTERNATKDFGSGRKVIIEGPEQIAPAPSSRDSSTRLPSKGGKDQMRSRDRSNSTGSGGGASGRQVTNGPFPTQKQQQFQNGGRTVTIDHAAEKSGSSSMHVPLSDGKGESALSGDLSHLPFDTRCRLLQEQSKGGGNKGAGSSRGDRSNVFNSAQMGIINAQLAGGSIRGGRGESRGEYVNKRADPRGGSSNNNGSAIATFHTKPMNHVKTGTSVSDKPVVVRKEFDRESRNTADPPKVSVQPSGEIIKPQNRRIETIDALPSERDSPSPVQVYVPPPVNVGTLKPYRVTKSWGDDDDSD